jgi:hypothetical protein
MAYDSNRIPTHDELYAGIVRAGELLEFAAAQNLRVKKVIVASAEPQVIFAGHDD